MKEAVFPFNRFPGVDTLLGPEMRSTGEVMGLDTGFGRAFAKSQLAAGQLLPVEGRLFLSVKESDRPQAVDLAKAALERWVLNWFAPAEPRLICNNTASGRKLSTKC